MLADIQVKYAQMLAPRALAESARAARETGADAIVVTGTRTGEPPSPDDVRRAHARAPASCPVLIGSGLDAANARALLGVADGAIVGTSLMSDGRATSRAGGRAGRGARVKIVCAADCGVDRHNDRGIDRAGGIGLNVAVHARRHCAAGASVTLVAPVGDDAGADLVRDAAARAGVETCLEVVPGATPVQHIRQAPDGERVFERFDEGVLAGFRVSERQRAAIAGSDVLATAAFGQGLTFFESVMACRPQGLTSGRLHERQRRRRPRRVRRALGSRARRRAVRAEPAATAR